MPHPMFCRSAADTANADSGCPCAWRLLWVACLSVALALPAAAIASNQDATTQPATGQARAGQPGTQPQVPADLVRQVENFYHAAAMGNYEAAAAYGAEILAGEPAPTALLDAFVEIHSRRSPDPVLLDQRLLTWSQTDAIGEITQQLVERINAGRVERAIDPGFIAEQLERLSRGNQAYRNAIDQLRNSGEYAVPVMIRYLTDPEKQQFHADIRRAMRDLGVDMLNPLLAATKMENDQVLASLALVLGDLGYDDAIPHLLELVQTRQNEAVVNAARQALTRLNHTGNSTAADEYYRLAEKFYYNQSPIVPNRRLGIATIWSWGGRNVGLVRTDVPPAIFNEIHAMRAAGNALALGQGQDQALALWLASNYRREGELAPGEVDRTQAPGSPDAGYYGTQAGTSYLMTVLHRAQADRLRLARGNRYNTADVSLRAIKSLQEIIGRGNIQQGETPLTAAMSYPDRRVRIEAAMALAQALPAQGFAGQEQVVPLLADALLQTGEPTVVVVMPDGDELNRAVEHLNGAGYRAVGTRSVTDAVTQAQALPSVDAMVIDSQLGDREVDDLLARAEGIPKLSGSAKLVLTTSEASRYEAMQDVNPTLATSTVRTGEGLRQAVEQARTNVGGLPLDSEAATELAMRSGNLLKQIGSGSTIFRLESGTEFLLSALGDERPEVRKLAGEVVALLDVPQAQPALLEAALRPEITPDVRISLLESLSQSAKRFGRRLDDGGVNLLLAAAADRANLEVQAAAAEAAGALNLPPDQARRLIIEETRTVEGVRSVQQAQAPGNATDGEARPAASEEQPGGQP